MRKILKKLLSAAVSLVLAGASMTSGTVRAASPDETYNYDIWSEAIPSQAGYVPDRAVSGKDLGVGSFDDPNDIFLAGDETFYIADTKNDRIVTADSKLSHSQGIYQTFTMPDGSETELSMPKGVYVSDYTGYIYIADSENGRVLVARKDSTVVLEVKMPQSELYTAPTFKPQKVIADKAGNIYVALGNITTGSAMFSPKGEFMGFYGANRVQPTAEIIGSFIRRLFLTEEKRLRRTRSVPTGITGFDIDGDFIYTCTASSTQKTDTVKKLNAAGKNIFAEKNISFGDNRPMYDASKNILMEPAITDIDISADGCINCLDYTTGRVFQYDDECGLLFIVGAKSDQLGGFTAPAAVESFGNCLYVVDSAKDTITVFRETAFGAAVHKANSLYNAGYYEEALEPWYEVLRHDGNYRRANIGVASALLRKGDYKGAMKYAKLAGSPDIYNKAFEGYRREFIRSHFTAIILTVTGISAAAVILHRRKKRRTSRKEK